VHLAADVTRPPQQALHERCSSPKRIGDHLAVLPASAFAGTKEDLPIYAIVRKNTYNPAKLARAGHALDEFPAVHAAQPGIGDSIDTETSPGRRTLPPATCGSDAHP